MKKLYIPKMAITHLNDLGIRVKNENDSILGIALIFDNKESMVERMGQDCQYLTIDGDDWIESKMGAKISIIQKGD